MARVDQLVWWSSFTPTSSAPKCARDPRGSVQPPITNSCSCTSFSFASRSSVFRIGTESRVLDEQPFPAACLRLTVELPAIARQVAEAEERRAGDAKDADETCAARGSGSDVRSSAPSRNRSKAMNAPARRSRFRRAFSGEFVPAGAESGGLALFVERHDLAVEHDRA